MSAGLLMLDVALERGNFSLRVKAEIPLHGVTAIKGPSGSGKTSLLRLIAGLEAGGRGRITMRGVSWLGQGRPLAPQHRRIGYVFQNAQLFSHLSVAQNLAYGWRRNGADPAVLAHVHEALGLGHLLGRNVADLSGGERQRVAIGRALAVAPKLLLLDEPLSGLDSERRADVLAHISQALAEAQVPALYVSHYQREINRIAQRVLRVENGRATGLQDLPEPLAVRIVARAPGGVARLALGEDEFEIPLAGEVGQIVWLRVSPSEVMVSRADPGPGSALVTLPARLATCSDGAAGPRLGFCGAGWRLDLTLAGAQAARLGARIGDTLWLSFGEGAFLPVLTRM